MSAERKPSHDRVHLLTAAPSSSSAFEAELDRWGPSATPRAILSLADAQTYCRRLATSHYENFPVVSWLLPKALHQHFYNVYAWCRWADDLGDETGDSTRALEFLGWWRSELANCYAGRPTHPVLIALRPTIDEFAIPPEPFEDLISAFEQDQRVNQYDNFDQLRDYCRRSADPVGRLVLRMCRQHTPENVAWSDSICTGLQLANFWQDVNRDLDIGRIYLPREDRERFRYSESELCERRTTPAFLELMKFEVDRARSFLRDGLPLIPRLPGRLQIDIDLFARGGLKILERIEGIGYRVWERRPKVTKGDAVKLLIGSMLRAAGRKIGIGRSGY
ncbi:MAG: squalene synthase HpnC [Planctomycetaceae bacterium]|nr:squalene synthase HpnC [Planctomycetaceae bacterium]